MNTKEKAQAAVDAAFALAEARFSRSFARPTVELCELGRTAGRACYAENKIQLSRTLLLENEEIFLAQTVGHEVAHFVTRALFGTQIAPHGEEWKAVMMRMDLTVTRCHSYDTKSVARGRWNSLL